MTDLAVLSFLFYPQASFVKLAKYNWRNQSRARTHTRNLHQGGRSILGPKDLIRAERSHRNTKAIAAPGSKPVKHAVETGNWGGSTSGIHLQNRSGNAHGSFPVSGSRMLLDLDKIPLLLYGRHTPHPWCYPTGSKWGDLPRGWFRNVKDTAFPETPQIFRTRDWRKGDKNYPIIRFSRGWKG